MESLSSILREQLCSASQHSVHNRHTVPEFPPPMCGQQAFLVVSLKHSHGGWGGVLHMRNHGACAQTAGASAMSPLNRSLCTRAQGVGGVVRSSFFARHSEDFCHVPPHPRAPTGASDSPLTLPRLLKDKRQMRPGRDTLSIRRVWALTLEAAQS